ncbi:Peptidyl-dipeptidase [Hexamita inflata]|uniref:Peptidyl-dipeptidase n=1 Tax=Hexamita inflata TaxID=28002 RepID=A0AA86RFH6_9EUKA|nr:Peptidyl-dipeptidase [Hexamita inflata]
MDLLTRINNDRINWNAITPESITKQLEESFAHYTKMLESIPTENPLEFYHDLIVNPGKLVTIVSHLNALRGDLKYSDVEVIAENLATKFTVAVYQNETLKKLLSEYTPTNDEEKRFLSIHLKKFRKQPEELMNEYTKLQVAYTDCVKEDQKENKLTIDYLPELVTGLAQNVIDHIYKKEENKLVLDSTGFVSQNILKCAESESLREQYWRFLQTQCMKNTQNVEEQLVLKHKIANVLGHETVCELNLEERMARSTAEIKKFYAQLKDAAYPAYLKDIQRLETKYNQKMKPWNLNFLVEKDKTEVCEFNIKEFNQYFEYDSFLERFLKFIQETYQVRLTKTDVPVWHESVMSFTITQKSDLLGTLYLDLIQRDNKRPGAWFNRLGPMTYFVACNFSPKPKEGAHELEFDEVNTLFHEFGHCFHAIMSKTRIEALAACEVPWDFVEVPSQFSENFSYEKDVLKKIGINSKGEPVSDELIEKLKKRKTYLNSVFIMGQMSHGMTDLMLHSSFDWQKEEADAEFSRIDKYMHKILADYRYDYGFMYRTIYRHFTHIFTSVYGYTCGYYSYFWSDVIQAHLFEEYEKNRDFQKYIKCILEPGNSKDPNEMIKEYCGGFEFGAFLRSYGLE